MLLFFPWIYEADLATLLHLPRARHKSAENGMLKELHSSRLFGEVRHPFFSTDLVVWVPKMCVNFFLFFLYFLFRWTSTLVPSSDSCPVCRKTFEQPHAEAQEADANFMIRMHCGGKIEKLLNTYRKRSLLLSLISIVLSLTHLSAFWFLSLSRAPSYSVVKTNTLRKLI